MVNKILVMSSKARKAHAAVGSLLQGVALIKYSYESTSIEDLYQLLLEEVQQFNCKVYLLQIQADWPNSEVLPLQKGTRRAAEPASTHQKRVKVAERVLREQRVAVWQHGAQLTQLPAEQR